MGKGEKKRIYVEIDDDLAKEFKKRCIDYDISMSEVLRPGLEEFLRTHPPVLDRKPNVD